MPAVHSGGVVMSSGQHVKIRMRGSCTRRGAALLASVVCVALLGACVPRPPGDFYDAPKPLPARFPGAVIWAERSRRRRATARCRVMYHSRDALLRDRAVTGTIYYPTGPAPRRRVAGRLVGARDLRAGVASARRAATAPRPGRGACARSSWRRTTSGWARWGAARVPLRAGRGAQRHRHRPRRPPDPVGARRPPVGRRSASPKAATRRCSPVSSPAATRPSSELGGVVAAAPGSNLTETFPGDTQVVIDVVTVMALYGGAEDHPQVHPEDYVTPLTAERAKVLDTGCVNEISLAIAGIPHDQLFTPRPAGHGAGPIGRDRERSRSRSERGADSARPGDGRHRRGPGPDREAAPGSCAPSGSRWRR